MLIGGDVLRYFKTSVIVVVLASWVLFPMTTLAFSSSLVVSDSLAAAGDEDNVNDPLESMNRRIFGFNEMVHENILGPVAEAYNDNVPDRVRFGVGNFLDNLSSPITFVNNLLQFNIHGALKSLVRTFINTTIGIGGIVDVMTEIDGKAHEEDFGQTLGVWGVGEGFYLVLPVFGPSNPRDVVGKFLIDPYFDLVGTWIDNTNQNETDYALMFGNGVDEFAGVVNELKQIKKTSIDYYAAIRSLYRQKRRSEISNGSEIELPPIPNLGYNIDPKEFDQSIAGASRRDDDS